MSSACDLLGLSRATWYRWQTPPPERKPKAPGPRSELGAEEVQRVLDVLNSERFVDQAPRQVYAKLLDEGTYLCSVRTMYRILENANQVRERRNQLRRPHYAKPELMATGPNQVWSWDITKLRGPMKWEYYYLYVILDIYSRYVVGWMLADCEAGELAQQLIAQTAERQGIDGGTLTLHSDRGPSMTSLGVSDLLARLEVTKSLNRPYCSNDNPYSESQFKTMKYMPTYPDRFGCQEDARVFCQGFFPWYNDEHYHSRLLLLTPGMVHTGQADEVLAQRQAVLDQAYLDHPGRFGKPPSVGSLPEAVWINPPADA